MKTGLIIILCALGHASNACSIGAKKNAQKNIDLLKGAFGMEPFYPNADLNTTGYSDTYITKSSDLDCNFNGDGNEQVGSLGPTAQPMALCKWKNLASNDNLDNEQYYMFSKTDKKTWGLLHPARGAKQTPAQGDSFAFAGHDKSPAAMAVLYSSPMLCSQNPLQLSFDYWMYSSAKVRVYALQQNTYTVLYNTSTDQCSNVKPTNGRCIVTIPPQTGPFHLAIQSSNLLNSFVIVDNVAVTGDLGAQCVGGAPTPAGAALAARSNAAAITQSSDLNCAGGTNCDWSNANVSPSDVPFTSVPGGTGAASTSQWLSATGESTPPSGDYFYASAPVGTTNKANLMSDYIDCQNQDGTLTYQAWMTKGVTLQVCIVDAQTLQPLTPCTSPVPPMGAAGQYKTTIKGPLKNARIMFVASNFNQGGSVAIDNIQYTARLCSQDVTTTAAPDGDAVACSTLSLHFDASTTSGSSSQSQQWTNAPSISGGTVVPYQVASKFQVSQSTMVTCGPSGGKCAGAVVDKSRNEVLVMQSAQLSPPLARAHYLQLSTHRGTFGSGIFVCTNTVPTISPSGDVDVVANPGCTQVNGPSLTYTEWRNGNVTGATLPAGTTQVFVVGTNPAASGSDEAGFLIDRINLLRDGTSTSGAMC